MELKYIKACTLGLVLILCVIIGFIVKVTVDLYTDQCHTCVGRFESCSRSRHAVWAPHRRRDRGHPGKYDRVSEDQFHCRAPGFMISHLIDLMIVVYRSNVIPPDPRDQNRVWPTHTRPSVHLRFGKDIENGKLTWTRTYTYGKEIFTLTEVTLHGNGGANGGVMIPQDGVYMVYSSVTFYHSPTNSTVPKDEHGVYRYRHGNSDVLMSRSTDVSRSFQYESYAMSDLSGNFDLKKGDIVYPWFHNISDVFDSPMVNFWGLYQIQPEI